MSCTLIEAMQRVRTFKTYILVNHNISFVIIFSFHIECSNIKPHYMALEERLRTAEYYFRLLNVGQTSDDRAQFSFQNINFCRIYGGKAAADSKGLIAVQMSH